MYINVKKRTYNIENFYLCIKILIIIIFFFIIVSLIIHKIEPIITYNNINNNRNINFFNSSQDINFNISSIKYHFSYKFNKVEVEYHFQFFERANNIIIPSDLSFYYNLNIFCLLKNSNNILQSLANIYQDKYFKCLEYCELNSSVNFGIEICNASYNCITVDLFDNNYLNLNDLKLLNDDIFNFKYVEKQYSMNVQNKLYFEDDQNLLKNSYSSKPICSIKEKVSTLKNIWFFKNIYNHYFCFCNGNYCKNINKMDTCKYYFYLSVIDDNKDIYKKTYYLLEDFLFAYIAPGDAYFLFKEMVKQNMSAFYMTARKDIYKEYYDNSTKLQKIIPIINKQYNIDGHFLEKYLFFFLRLKSVISGSEFFSKENIFYIIPYITFICLGHGVNYFKPFLYKDYYGCKRYNKIILPSEKIISIAKKYGWKDKNIIKIGLPKWDLFNNFSLEIKNQFKENCIFMMFTWRNFKRRKKLSRDYFNNILKLLNNNKLNQLIKKNNITIYLSLHHNLIKKRNIIKKKENIKYINQENILNCLMKCDLAISDFSSIIFDFMYRKKPIIVFVPDSNDKNIHNLYDDDYMNVINGIKNGSIEFENKFFSVEDTIKKLIYYINNNFELDQKLKSLYKKFDLNNNRNINRIIEYLNDLK